MNAVFRFHLQVGTRIALRIFVPVVAVFFALYYLLRPELFNSLTALILEGGFLLSGTITTFFCLIFASFASRRVCLGLNGWIRHLPATGANHRRMAGIALVIAQLPVLVIMGGLAVVAIKLEKIPAIPYLLGLPLLGLSCGFCVLPVKRTFIIRPLVVLAGICFAANNWGYLAAGFPLLIAADGLSGPLVQKKKRKRSQRLNRGVFLMASINWRALRLRPIVPYLLSLPLLGGALLFISNNSPAPHLAEQMIRLGGSLSLILFCSIFTKILASRRPPWPWARSLPWSAKSRILWDTFYIGLHMLPLLILSGIMNPKTLFFLAASLPLFAAYSAYSIRQLSGSSMGATGKIILIGTIASLLLCLFPWSSLLFLASLPLILNAGIEAEKHQKVSRWLELQHLAAGDSLSWSDR